MSLLFTVACILLSLFAIVLTIAFLVEYLRGDKPRLDCVAGWIGCMFGLLVLFTFAYGMEHFDERMAYLEKQSEHSK